ncbi:unnamed protein product, partial [Coregonus sp. 'balchen']
MEGDWKREGGVGGGSRRRKEGGPVKVSSAAGSSAFACICMCVITDPTSACLGGKEGENEGNGRREGGGKRGRKQRRRDGERALTTDFFRKKAEIETEYSRNLEKLAERFMAKTRSTKDHQQKDQNLLSPVNCWYLLLNQVRRESKDHATLSDLYLNNVITRLTHISDDSARLLKRSKEITFQLQEDMMKLLNELYTVMKTYHMYHGETLNAETKLRDAERQVGPGGGVEPLFGMRIEERHQRRNAVRKMEKMREKRKAKYSENKLKSLKARNEYLLTMEATNSSVFKYYIHDLPDIIDCCDLGYHSSLSRALKTYLSAELSLEASRRTGLEVLEGAVEGLDPARDRQRLLGLYPTAFCPPPRFSFQPHMGDPVTQIAAQPQVQAELASRLQQLQSRLSTLKIENEEVKKTWGATLTTLQDMTVLDDYDVSQSFTHSPSSESVKSSVSDGYLNKPSLAKRRANQQETELFYFTKFREYLEGSNLISKLQAKHDLLKKAMAEGYIADTLTTSRGRNNSHSKHQDSTKAIPLLVESCIRYINLHGLQHQGIFRVSGSQVEVNDIKNSFERGHDPLIDEENNHDINSVAGVLSFRGWNEAPSFRAWSHWDKSKRKACLLPLLQLSVKFENLLAHQEGHTEVRATDDWHMRRMLRRDYIVRAISQRGETEEREKRRTEKEKRR